MDDGPLPGNLERTIGHFTLGQTIRRLREQRRWSQGDLAAVVGTTARTVGNWERDEAKPRNRLGSLEEVFGVQFDVVFESGGVAYVAEAKSATSHSDPVIRAIEESRLTRGNQHKLIGTYYVLLDEQDRSTPQSERINIPSQKNEEQEVQGA